MDRELDREPILDMFVFETSQLIEQLEQILLDGEETSRLVRQINELFRIMHTIKGSASMMMYDDISALAHAIEDVFYYLREEKPEHVDYSKLTDIVLAGVDFIKGEISKIVDGSTPNQDSRNLAETIRNFLAFIKQANRKKTHEEQANREKPDPETPDPEKSSQELLMEAADSGNIRYQAVLFFDEDCGMENVRAFAVVHNLGKIADILCFSPPDIAENTESAEVIRREGFHVVFNAELGPEEIRSYLLETAFIRHLELDRADRQEAYTDGSNAGSQPDCMQIAGTGESDDTELNRNSGSVTGSRQNMISVDVTKLDSLMDLVGELVISEAMVIQHPELKDMNLDGFYKAARQLHKITGELQDIVMSIRMVPLSATFHKMHRIVRDMSKKLNKQVRFHMSGAETEVDKNIIEHISDPLMHLIRNALDHGLESTGERSSAGKPETGGIWLEARNVGGDVVITVKDDGRGLDRGKILEKARESGLLGKPENGLSDQEVFSFILQPGLSTKENISEYSGRGVGMDVVVKNLEQIRGTVSIESSPGEGTAVSVKIPLTLAIIDGMIVKTGSSCFIIPVLSIRESFRITGNDIVRNIEGQEMVMVRGECFPIIRLHRLFSIKTDITSLYKGITILVESGKKSFCIFADALLGEQSIVVKALPGYIKRVRGITGCTLLGDGSIGLILDMEGLSAI